MAAFIIIIGFVIVIISIYDLRSDFNNPTSSKIVLTISQLTFIYGGSLFITGLFVVNNFLSYSSFYYFVLHIMLLINVYYQYKYFVPNVLRFKKQGIKNIRSELNNIKILYFEKLIIIFSFLYCTLYSIFILIILAINT